MERRDWPIVVGGCHRSGTSVLRRALDAHSRIHCGPEIKFFRDFYGDYPEDPLLDFRFARTARSILPEGELMDVLGTAFVRIHELAARRAGKARWADKAPENVLHTDEWRRLLGDEWILVHVVRNPLDTVASMTEIGFPRTLPATLDGKVAFYRAYTEAGIEFGRRNRDQYVRVVYEELVASPEPIFTGLMEKLGERFEPSQLVWGERQYQSGLEDPNVRRTDRIHGDSIGRWPALLTSAEAELVRRETTELWRAIDPEGRYAAV